MAIGKRTPHLHLLAVGSLLILLASIFLAMFVVQFMNEADNGSMEFSTWINEKREIFKRSGKQNPVFDINGGIERGTDKTRSYSGGGDVIWTRKVLEGSSEPISTPLLVDLNRDNDLEVVAVSTDDAVMAFESDGNSYWNSPYTDIVVEYLGATSGTSGLDFDPPNFIVSPKSFDYIENKGPNLLVGGKDGLYCLNSDGGRAWVGGSTTGWYFSSAAITDLEGEFENDLADWEIIIASDDEGRRGWIEVLDIYGNTIERTEAPTGGEGGLIATAIVAEDLDGSYWDGPWKSEPEWGEEREIEVMCGNHDRGLRIWSTDGLNENGGPKLTETTGGWLAGHQTYATHAVANVTGSEAMEIFVGSQEGYPRTWTGWGGKLYVYAPDGRKLWDYSTGSSRASVFSSPCVADLQMAKFDPDEIYQEYEVIFGSDNGKLYVMSTEYHSLRWNFDTGGRCMSSPAICDIYSDGDLEIIVGSDSGKVFCLDGDPSDNIDEGIQYPKDGYSQDVLWVYDAGAPIGISSPVVADIDHDGILEVLIGDKEGTIHCISAGGVCRKGQSDWPTFHQNNNNTGFYNPDERSVIDLHPRVMDDGSRSNTTIILKPGASHEFDLSVRYDGTTDFNERERIYLRIKNGTLPDGWSADIDAPPIEGEADPDHVMLRKGQSCDISVTIQAPIISSEPITAHIIMIANHSKDTWVRDTLLLQVKLDLHPGVDVRFDSPIDDDPLSPYLNKKWEPIIQGREFDVDVVLENNGTMNDTIVVDLPEPPAEAGWNWFFLGTGKTSLEIDLIPRHLVGRFAGEYNVTLNVRIQCPIEAFAEQEMPIIVTAESTIAKEKFGITISSRDVFYMVVSQKNDLWLDIANPSGHTRPGVREEVHLRITNLGNRDVIMVELSNGSLPEGWSAELPGGDVAVYRGQTKIVSCHILPPEDAVAGSSAIFTLQGRIKDQYHVFSQASIVIKVDQVHDHDIFIYGEWIRDGEPGENVEFKMVVENKGNGLESFYFEPEIPSTWSLHPVDQADRKVHSISLDPFSLVELRVNITIGRDAPAGLNRIFLKIDSENGTWQLPFDIWILQVRGLEISSSDGSGSMVLNSQLNKVVKANFMVTNTGNGMERANIMIGGMGDHGSLIEIPDNTKVGLFSVSQNKDQKGEIIYWNASRPLDLSYPLNGKVFVPEKNRFRSPLSNDDPFTLFSIELDPGGSAFIEIWVKQRNGADIDDDKENGIIVSAFCEGLRKVLPIEINLRYPDMFFYGGIQIAGSTVNEDLKANEGDRLTFIVKLGNKGEVNSENVVVQLYVDNKAITNVTLPYVPISLSDSKVVMLTWEAKKGRHHIKIVIDPRDSIIEENDIQEDNEIHTKIDVQGEGLSLESGSPLLLVSLALGFLIPIIIVTAILGFRRKNDRR